LVRLDGVNVTRAVTAAALPAGVDRHHEPLAPADGPDGIGDGGAGQDREAVSSSKSTGAA
jgi:hypothetical protein